MICDLWQILFSSSGWITNDMIFSILIFFPQGCSYCREKWVDTCLSLHCRLIVSSVEFTWNRLIIMFFTDRARVAGGLPDVVTIQEGKVVYMLLCMGWKDKNDTKITKLSLPSSLVVSEPDLQYLGRPRTRGHLAKERAWDGFQRSLHSEVWLGQVCQFHHHLRQYVWLRQVQHPGKEQVRYGERRLHRKCLPPRRGTRQEKIKQTKKKRKKQYDYAKLKDFKDLKRFRKF